jgi:hypothetical protein
MLTTIVSHAVAFLFGAGGVFIYLHKHTVAAVNLSTKLASDVADVKIAAAAVKNATGGT